MGQISSGIPLAGSQPGAPVATAYATAAGPTSDAGQEAEQKAASLPRCDAPLDTLALVENQDAALASMGLTSPLPILRVMITQSNCFTVVDRGPALQLIEAERKISGKGGAGKLAAARYFLTPQIVFQNSSNSSIGGAISSVMGALPVSGMPAVFGTVASNMTQTTSEAQSVLFLTDANTGMQVLAASGTARTSEIGFTTAGLGSVLGAGGAYATTDAGKTAAAALADAYASLVAQVRSQKQVAKR